MNEQAVRVEYDLGDNIFGQRVTLVRERATGGGFGWTIHRHEANQRDDSSVVRGLTGQQLHRMAAIAGDRR